MEMVHAKPDDCAGTDPRPKATFHHGDVLIQGWRCDDCALARAERSPRCPECGGHLGEAEFGPEGTVWSSTIVHLDIGGITAPYGLAYVDLDDGPRFLAHTTDALSPIPVGAPVKIVGTTPAGDVQVAPIDREAAS